MSRSSRRSIIQQLSKRFETTIIGSLARIEDNFGYLWGYNSDKDLTPKQKEFEELWEFTRTAILNHGNKQMREAIDEIIEYIHNENDTLRYKLTLFNTDQRKEKEGPK
jgi:O6-methylguanine-DNA--protein-cysteine methyltransferase